MSYFQPALWLGTEPDLPDRTIGKHDIFPLCVEGQVQSLLRWYSGTATWAGGREDWVGTSFAPATTSSSLSPHNNRIAFLTLTVFPQLLL